MAKHKSVSENPRGVDSKYSPSSTPYPITTWELVASGDGIGATKTLLPTCPGARSSFFINFCNIRGLLSNLHFVEHHRLSSRPYLLFLTETQVSECSDSIPYYLSSSNLISDRQYSFRKKRSTGDLLSLHSYPWSSALRHFFESFAVALDISKAFDRV